MIFLIVLAKLVQSGLGPNHIWGFQFRIVSNLKKKSLCGVCFILDYVFVF